jgi:hypothetical protein
VGWYKKDVFDTSFFRGLQTEIGLSVASIAIIDLLRFAPMETSATLPKRLAPLFEQVHLFLLPHRREDSYPKVVKLRNFKCPKKMPVSS